MSNVYNDEPTTVEKPGPVIHGKGSDSKYHPIAVGSDGSLTLSAGTGASSLGKAEDAPHTSGDTGVMTLGVRNDANATLTSADLDYSPLNVDSTGRLKLSSFATSNIGPQKAEDGAHASSDAGIAIWGVRADTDAVATSATGDYGFMALDSHNRQKVVDVLTIATVSAPAAGSQATASIALQAGLRHVCRSLSFGIHTVAAPGAAATVIVTLRDGATGAGTVIRSWSVRVPNTADANVFEVDLSNLSLVGTVGTAMTLEFSAGVTGAFEWCNLSTYMVV